MIKIGVVSMFGRKRKQEKNLSVSINGDSLQNNET